jgi:LemA protein
MPVDTLAIIILGLLIIALLGVWLFNGFVHSRQRTREAWAGVDVQLKRRANLIPNLVETVKGYAAHERGLFEEVTRTRNFLQQAGGASETARANHRLTQTLARLLAVAENYPEIKASENFLNLQTELFDVEEKIAYARQFYNRNVAEFNARIKSAPGIIIARLGGFQPFGFFAADEELDAAKIRFT